MCVGECYVHIEDWLHIWVRLSYSVHTYIAYVYIQRTCLPKHATTAANIVHDKLGYANFKPISIYCRNIVHLHMWKSVYEQMLYYTPYLYSTYLLHIPVRSDLCIWFCTLACFLAPQLLRSVERAPFNFANPQYRNQIVRRSYVELPSRYF